MSQDSAAMPNTGSPAYRRDGNVEIERTTPFASDRQSDPSQSAQSSFPTFPSQIPSHHRWDRASGLVEPIFGPCRTLQDLEAIVGECESAGMSDFSKILEWYRRHYHSNSPSKEQGEALSWSSEYANFVFLACEFFVPREPFKCRQEDRPTLFQSQLTRDEAISWMLSFIMGEVFNHKTVTSRMQSISKWFEGKVSKKQGNLHLWNRLHSTYQQSGSDISLARNASSTRRQIPADAQEVTKDHILHPFLAYLLCIHDYQDLRTALQQPYLNVSSTKCPGGFEVVWRGIECDMSIKAKQAADARRSKESGGTPAQPKRGADMNPSLNTVVTPKKRKARPANGSLKPQSSKSRKDSLASQISQRSSDESKGAGDMLASDPKVSKPVALKTSQMKMLLPPPRKSSLLNLRASPTHHLTSHVNHLHPLHRSRWGTPTPQGEKSYSQPVQLGKTTAPTIRAVSPIRKRS